MAYLQCAKIVPDAVARYSKVMCPFCLCHIWVLINMRGQGFELQFVRLIRPSASEYKGIVPVEPIVNSGTRDLKPSSCQRLSSAFFYEFKYTVTQII